MTPTLISSIHELLSLWELKRTLLASSTEPIAVDKDLSFLAVDIISQLAFGQSYELLSGTTALVREQGPRAPGQAFGRKMSEIGEASALIFEVRRSPLPLNCFSQLAEVELRRAQSLPAESIYPALSRFVQKLTTPRVRRAEAQLFAFLDGNIVEGRRRVRGGESVDGLLGSILEKEREDEVKTGAELMAVQEIRDEMITFLVAVGSLSLSPFTDLAADTGDDALTGRGDHVEHHDVDGALPGRAPRGSAQDARGVPAGLPARRRALVRQRGRGRCSLWVFFSSKIVTCRSLDLIRHRRDARREPETLSHHHDRVPRLCVSSPSLGLPGVGQD